VVFDKRNALASNCISQYTYHIYEGGLKREKFEYPGGPSNWLSSGILVEPLFSPLTFLLV